MQCSGCGALISATTTPLTQQQQVEQWGSATGGGDAGGGCDAPGLWQSGKHEQLERYCQRDTEALAELVVREWIKTPGGTGTAHVSLRGRVWPLSHASMLQSIYASEQRKGHSFEKRKVLWILYKDPEQVLGTPGRDGG